MPRARQRRKLHTERRSRDHIAVYPPGASHSVFMPSPTWAPRFLSHFRGALFSSQRATARIGLLRPSLAHGVEPVARSGPFHGDPAPMAPRVSRCVGGSREFSGGSREWSTPSWCMLMHHARAGPQITRSFLELAHPPRSVVSSFVQVSSFVEMIFFADARTFGGGCSFGMF